MLSAVFSVFQASINQHNTAWCTENFKLKSPNIIQGAPRFRKSNHTHAKSYIQEVAYDNNLL